MIKCTGCKLLVEAGESRTVGNLMHALKEGKRIIKKLIKKNSKGKKGENKKNLEKEKKMECICSFLIFNDNKQIDSFPNDIFIGILNPTLESSNLKLIKFQFSFECKKLIKKREKNDLNSQPLPPLPREVF